MSCILSHFFFFFEVLFLLFGFDVDVDHDEDQVFKLTIAFMETYDRAHRARGSNPCVRSFLKLVTQTVLKSHNLHHSGTVLRKCREAGGFMQFSENSDAETGLDLQSNWVSCLEGQIHTNRGQPASLRLPMSPLVDH